MKDKTSKYAIGKFPQKVSLTKYEHMPYEMSHVRLAVARCCKHLNPVSFRTCECLFFPSEILDNCVLAACGGPFVRHAVRCVSGA